MNCCYDDWWERMILITARTGAVCSVYEVSFVVTLRYGTCQIRDFRVMNSSSFDLWTSTGTYSSNCASLVWYDEHLDDRDLSPWLRNTKHSLYHPQYSPGSWQCCKAVGMGGSLWVDLWQVQSVGSLTQASKFIARRSFQMWRGWWWESHQGAVKMLLAIYVRESGWFPHVYLWRDTSFASFHCSWKLAVGSSGKTLSSVAGKFAEQEIGDLLLAVLTRRLILEARTLAKNWLWHCSWKFAVGSSGIVVGICLDKRLGRLRYQFLQESTSVWIIIPESNRLVAAQNTGCTRTYQEHANQEIGPWVSIQQKMKQLQHQWTFHEMTMWLYVLCVFWWESCDDLCDSTVSNDWGFHEPRFHGECESIVTSWNHKVAAVQ